jgi:hypothetical protein
MCLNKGEIRIRGVQTISNKNAVVVGDAKAWNVALDKSRQGKVLREAANPSKDQIFLLKCFH